jgi:hypothetical protein
MSDAVLQELVVRMATDAGFADRVRNAPEETLGSFDLTPAEVAQLSSLGADAGATTEALAARQSKSSLLFMGAAHHVDHGALAPTGLHDAGAPHVNLHDPGTSLHGAETHHSVGPQSHMDGDIPIMITDPKHDLFQGGGSHSNSSDGDIPIMITDPKHDLFQGGGSHNLDTGGIHPGTGEQMPGSGPVESPEKQSG